MSRRSPVVALAVVLVAVVLAACTPSTSARNSSARNSSARNSAGARSSTATTPTRAVRTPIPSTAKPTSTAGRSSAIPAGAQAAVVVSITDGDTVRLQASSGTAPLTTSVTKVRLLELDTPETKDPNAPVECFGPQASAYTARLLPVGSTVWVTADRELLDRYGRTLLYLWRPDGLFVNREIVRQGYARAVLYEPNDRYIATMRTAENEARKAGRGLWSACASPSTSAAINQFASKPATTQPAPSPSTAQGAACEPAYPDVCIPPYATAGDLDCGDIPYRRFRVLPPDPDRFDSDHDGIGCESG